MADKKKEVPCVHIPFYGFMLRIDNPILEGDQNIKDTIQLKINGHKEKLEARKRESRALIYAEERKINEYLKSIGKK